MERPVGITILAVLAIIGGLISIAAGLSIGILGGITPGVQGPVGLIGVVALIVGILQLIYGFGLWTLKPWAWLLALIGSLLSAISGLVQIFAGGNASGGLLSIIIAAIIVWNLTTPDIKRAFRR
jgi:hypothetical protein